MKVVVLLRGSSMHCHSLSGGQFSVIYRKTQMCTSPSKNLVEGGN